MKFNDPDIREVLKHHLQRLPTKPKVIIDELHVHRGNAIADVVAIYKDAHCFEIKGDNDSLNRIERQGSYYNLVFNKITLVTTPKHAENALSKISKHWGLIVVSNDGKDTTLKYLRRVSNNPYFNKEQAFQTLWRQEIISIIDRLNLKVSTKLNKQELASHLASNLSKEETQMHVAEILSVRSPFNIQSF